MRCLILSAALLLGLAPAARACDFYAPQVVGYYAAPCPVVVPAPELVLPQWYAPTIQLGFTTGYAASSYTFTPQPAAVSYYSQRSFYGAPAVRFRSRTVIRGY